MHVARLFDRKIALIDGAESLRAITHLFRERQSLEHLGDFEKRFVVKADIDAVAREDRESDLMQRIAELLREIWIAHVARAHDKFIVELFDAIRFSQLIRLA